MNKDGFKKWYSFENHYNEKFITFFNHKNPDQIQNSEFQITEKLDGANFSIIFTPYESPVFCKRSGVIKEKFFNYHRLFENEEYSNFIEKVQNAVDNMGEIKLQFIGELFGKGIQKRINYGNDIYWRWFGIYETHPGVDTELVTLEKEIEYQRTILSLNNYDIFSLKTPIYRYSASYKDFQSFEVENLQSLVCDDLAEGVCIRNWGETIQYGDDKFLLKKKSEKFVEDAGKIRKAPREVPEKITEYVELASTYVNKNRTLSLFSKEGEIKEMKEFGKYMSLYSNDLFEDFDKNNNYILEELDKRDVKLIKKFTSALIREELMRYVGSK